MRISLAKLTAAESQRQPGYVAALRAAGIVEGDWLTVRDAKLREIVERFHPEKLNRIPHKSPQEPLPSMATMAANLARAAGRAATAIVKGKPIAASEEQIADRTAICTGSITGKPCDHFRPSDGRCSLCGCGLTRFLSKIKLATERCPVGKW